MHPTLRQGLALVNRFVTGRGLMRSAGRAKPRRSVAPKLDALERRECLLFAVKATITPAPIFPPTGKFIPVTLHGTFTEYEIGGKKPIQRSLPGPKKANFQVVDEYRQVEPFGPIPLIDKGNGVFDFSVTFHLQARRSTQFPAGRRYWVIVGAKDTDGWAGKVVHTQVPISLEQRGQPPIPHGKTQKAAGNGQGHH